MTNTDWSDVRRRVARLAEAAGDDAVFGSADHGWELEPPLEPGELAEVEARLGVELPGEYRSFLLEVSRGGAGPAYGLFPIRRVDGRWRWIGDGADLTDLDSLGRPFPHTEAFNPADGLPEPPDEADFDSPEDFEAAEEAYWERHDAIVFDPRHYAGLLYLCHLGCAYREALVVTGPDRGRMWADDTADGDGFRPLRDDAGNPLTFAGWYRHWLTEAETKAGLAPV
ncbi:SMI1/KNR4 family protein [Bailinhaonella thermotolerans]|uniref:SMI1/KNR4 family protein n=1 Tax=Bailinhaonella thermotolerans TaxID=1070861 RepID=A0A3A4A9F2_9ACTN|nr:SMI1/KNR4 family protein [Bailinhaonella thermotolerans]RJL22585.1 SMI1/KNR4 family protein [Bailinhaonella thermotolerans]